MNWREISRAHELGVAPWDVTDWRRELEMAGRMLDPRSFLPNIEEAQQQGLPLTARWWRRAEDARMLGDKERTLYAMDAARVSEGAERQLQQGTGYVTIPGLAGVAGCSWQTVHRAGKDGDLFVIYPETANGDGCVAVEDAAEWLTRRSLR